MRPLLGARGSLGPARRWQSEPDSKSVRAGASDRTANRRPEPWATCRASKTWQVWRFHGACPFNEHEALMATPSTGSCNQRDTIGQATSPTLGTASSRAHSSSQSKAPSHRRNPQKVHPGKVMPQ
jgi:hypothetical protein